MADNLNDSFSSFGVDDQEITRLQALFRGALVRKQMQELRKFYEDILSEIEQNPKTHADWKSMNLCAPIVHIEGKGKCIKPKEIEKTVKDDIALSPPHHERLGTDTLSQVPSIRTEVASPKSSETGNVEAQTQNGGDVYQSTNGQPSVIQSVLEQQNTDDVDINFVEPQDSQFGIDKAEKNETPNNQVEYNSDDNKREDEQHTEQFSPTNQKTHFESEVPQNFRQMNQQKMLNADGLEVDSVPNDSERTESLNSQPELNGQFKFSDDRISHTPEQCKIPYSKPAATQTPQNNMFSELGVMPLNSDSDQETLQKIGLPNAETSKDSPVQYHKTMMKSPSLLQDKTRVSSSKSENMSHLSQSSEPALLGDMTSVWDSVNTIESVDPFNSPTKLKYPRDLESLRKLRGHVALELLWVQQAISSRKNYLRLKASMQKEKT